MSEPKSVYQPSGDEMSKDETWEYLAVWFNDEDNQDRINDLMDRHGSHGWELVSVVIDRGALAAFYKRALSHAHAVAMRKEMDILLPDSWVNGEEE